MTPITKAELAKELNVSKARVTQLGKRGMPVRTDGRVNRDEALRWITQHMPGRSAAYQAAVAATGGAQVSTTVHKPAGEQAFTEARRMKENYLALLRRLEYEAKTERLIDREEAERIMAQTSEQDRRSWEAWPEKVARRMASELNIDAVALRRELTRHITRHLLDLDKRDKQNAAK